MTDAELDRLEKQADTWECLTTGEALDLIAEVRRLQQELAETQQRMRTGWRLVEREGIDQPQPLLEKPPRPHPPLDLKPMDCFEEGGP